LIRLSQRNRKIYLGILIFFVGYIINLYLNRYLLSHLSLASYGDYRIFESLLYVLVPLTTLGGIFGANYFIPHYFRQDKHYKVLAFLVLFAGVSLISMVVLLIVSLVLLPAVESSSIKHYLSMHHAFEYLYIFPVVGIYSLILRSLNAKGHFYLASFSKKIFFPLGFVLTLMLLEKIENGHRLGNVFYIYGAVYLILILILGSFLFKNSGWMGWPYKDKYETKSWLRSSVSLLSTEIIVSIITQADLLVLEMVGAFESDVGVFGALLALVHLIWIIYSAALFLSTSEISSCLHEKKYAQLGALANRVQLKLAVFSVFLVLMVILFANHILAWVDPHLIYYKGLFLFVFIGVILSLPSYLKVTIFTMSEHRRIQTITNIISLLIVVVLELVLVPKYRIWGAAVPLVLSRCFLAFSGFYYCHKKLNLPYFSTKIS
jgi:O-antigen/teichoic acid export membrane protein